MKPPSDPSNSPLSNPIPSLNVMIRDPLTSGIAPNDPRAANPITMRRIRTINAYTFVIVLGELLGLVVMIPLGLLHSISSCSSSSAGPCVGAHPSNIVAHLQTIYSILVVLFVASMTGGPLGICLPIAATIPLWAGQVLGMRGRRCGSVLAHKDRRSIVMRTVFGKAKSKC